MNNVQKIIYHANKKESIILSSFAKNCPYNKKHFSIFKTEMLLKIIQQYPMNTLLNDFRVKNYYDNSVDRINNCLFFELFEHKVLKEMKKLPYIDESIYQWNVKDYNYQEFCHKSMKKLFSFSCMESLKKLIPLNDILVQTQKENPISKELFEEALYSIENHSIGNFFYLFDKIKNNSRDTYLLEESLSQYFQQNHLMLEIQYLRCHKNILKKIPENYNSLSEFVDSLDNQFIKDNFSKNNYFCKSKFCKLVSNFNMSFNYKPEDFTFFHYRTKNFPHLQTIQLLINEQSTSMNSEKIDALYQIHQAIRQNKAIALVAEGESMKAKDIIQELFKNKFSEIKQSYSSLDSNHELNFTKMLIDMENEIIINNLNNTFYSSINIDSEKKIKPLRKI